MATTGYKMYINGEWVDKDQTFADYNPANGAVWAEIPNGTRDDVKRAVAAAAAAQTEWAALPHPQRAGYLLTVSAWIVVWLNFSPTGRGGGVSWR